MRPGEALDCIHAEDMPAGCGTSQFCAECGAAKAMVKTIEKKEAAVEECRISRWNNGAEEALDLHVHTSVITLAGKQFTVFSIKDIAGEKRRKALERIFFHDILNLAGALDGLIGLLPEIDGPDLAEIEESLPIVSTQLINEINGQRQLLQAESGVLVADLQSHSLNKLLSTAGRLYVGHLITKDKTITVTPLETDRDILTDATLLIRSLGNLIKNALEASEAGDEVKVFADASEEEIRIHVWNNSVMTPSVQLQMFHRSFSTKAPNGRGIGAYSVKLLIEHYLKGKVSFVSNEKEKTTFTIALPRRT
jgi:signal transduction histidine kinase